MPNRIEWLTVSNDFWDPGMCLKDNEVVRSFLVAVVQSEKTALTLLSLAMNLNWETESSFYITKYEIIQFWRHFSKHFAIVGSNEIGRKLDGKQLFSD